MPKQREQLREAATAAAWHVRFDWLRARENLGAEAELQRSGYGRGWRVVKNPSRRCVGRGATIADALDAAMRNPTA